MTLNLTGRDSHWQGNGTQMKGLVPGLSTDGGRTGLWGLLTCQGSIHSLVPHQLGPSVLPAKSPAASSLYALALVASLSSGPGTCSNKGRHRTPLPRPTARSPSAQAPAAEAELPRSPSCTPGRIPLSSTHLLHATLLSSSPPGLFGAPGPNLSVQPPGTSPLIPVRPSPPRRVLASSPR